jgi:class 3 adenylate cyclase
MTGISDEVENAVQTTLDTAWVIRDGIVVPETDDVTLKNGAVKVEAAYLYADLADSSGAAQTLKKEVTAKIIRSYVNAAVRIIRNKGGHIRSFDGDRVMGIFIGKTKRNDAARAALAINWAVDEVLAKKFSAKWPDLKNNYKLNHGVGIDCGEALIVRAGVRDNNDLVSIGAAPNIAAKLSELRGAPDLYVTTDNIYNYLNDPQKLSKGVDMWTNYGTVTVGGKNYSVKGSTYRWKP